MADPLDALNIGASVEGMSSTVEWLRARTDAEIAGLLTARPDLLLPAPPDLAALARRIDSIATVRRAISTCTAFELQVLQAIWVLCGHPSAVAFAEPSDPPVGAAPPSVARMLGGPATTDDVTRAIGQLHRLALVRAQGSDYVLGPTTAEALGRFPAGLAPASPEPLSADDITRALAGCDDTGRALLERLLPGPPVGSVPANSPNRVVVDRLVEAGLLIDQGDSTVVLRQEVSLALRGKQPLGPAVPEPPEFVTREYPSGTIDGAAAGQSLAAHGLMVRLLNSLGDGGLSALKSGGVGAVPTRKLAKQLELETSACALYLELGHACGLIAPAISRGGSGAVWLPTEAADMFLNGSETGGWALLASAWLDLRRDPSRVGLRDDEDRPINALSGAVEWRRGPYERRRVLREISLLPKDVAPEQASVVDRLHFAAPLARRAALAELTQTVLAEATELGVVAFDALSAPGAALLDDDIEGAAAALTATLPPPVETFLLQADMTIVAPGRLTRELAAALAEIADVESAGSATVYRISEVSIRRALDAGATRSEIVTLLEQHSTTEVPQSVRYLIDDVARRHGVLRAGSVEAVVHSDDPALVRVAISAAASAGIPLRELAPTVAVSPVDLETLIEVLRAAGLAPAAEDVHGDIVDLRHTPARTRAPMPARISYRDPASPSPEQVEAVVRRMRASSGSATAIGTAGEAAGLADSTGPTANGVAQNPRDVLDLLRDAARTRSVVWISYAGTEGGISTRAVEPLSVSGGVMVAFDKLRNTPIPFTLARIHSAHL